MSSYKHHASQRASQGPCHFVCISCLVVIACGLSCGSGSGRSDDDLGGLVYKAKAAIAPIDVDKAVRTPSEFTRAIMLPDSYVASELGAYHATVKTSLKVSERGAEVFTLDVDTEIKLDDAGGYHARLQNSADYGREVYFIDGVLFLRPRYGKFHRRSPTEPAEPKRIRAEMFAGLAEHWELVAPAMELAGAGESSVAGRPVRTVTMGLDSEHSKTRPVEQHKRSKWRESITVKALKGSAALDKQTGVPLSCEVDATISYTRDDKNYEMSFKLTHTVRPVTAGKRLAAPHADQTVVATELAREVDDRSALLEAIAPPSPTVDVPVHRSLRRRRPGTTSRKDRKKRNEAARKRREAAKSP